MVLLEEDLWHDILNSLSYKHPLQFTVGLFFPFPIVQPHPEALFSGSLRIELKFFNLASSWSLICSANHLDIFMLFSANHEKIPLLGFQKFHQILSLRKKERTFDDVSIVSIGRKRGGLSVDSMTLTESHILVFLSFSSLITGSTVCISQKLLSSVRIELKQNCGIKQGCFGTFISSFPHHFIHHHLSSSNLFPRLFYITLSHKS